MKTTTEMIPFLNKQVNVQLEDGGVGYGVLRIWQMQGPREYPFVLDPAQSEETRWAKNRRFYAREVVEIHLST